MEGHKVAQVRFTFSLRFAEGKVRQLSEVYRTEDDRVPEAVGRTAKARGWFTKREFLDICRWKTPRAIDHCAENSEQFIKWATRTALSSTLEEARIKSLTLLQGVKWPTASVILHFAHRDRYPILDVRALWSMGYSKPPRYDFWLWWAYTKQCRRLAARQGVSMRTLDRAL